jgi:hypothetical protein
MEPLIMLPSCWYVIVVVGADQVLLWTVTSVGRRIASLPLVPGTVIEGVPGTGGAVLGHV